MSLIIFIIEHNKTTSILNLNLRFSSSDCQIRCYTWICCVSFPYCMLLHCYCVVMGSDSQVTFLQTRPMDLDSATLIACGTGGWVQMWNIYGGGLIGEFNIWDNLRHRLDKEDRQLQSITALKIDSNNDLMITGNSIGYIQVTWLLTVAIIQYHV